MSLDPDSNELSEFSGVAGRVAFLAFNPLNLVIGVLLGIAFFTFGWACEQSGATLAAMVVPQLGIAVVLSRYAASGRAGEWWGTPFSSAAGPFTDTIGVAARYSVLTLAWMVPLIAAGFSPEAMARLTSGPKAKIVAMLVAYLMASVFTPPAFLVLALRARTLGELFTPDHWRRCFGGRLGDLFVLYAMMLGGGMMAVLLMLPGVLLFGSSSVTALTIVGGFALCFIGGYGADVTGRLAGFYAAGAAKEPPGRVVETAPRRAVSIPARAPAVVAIPPLALPAGAARAALSTPGPVVPAATVGASAVGLANGKVVLLDAREPIELAWARFPTDPAGALAMLEELRRSYVPHPHVLQALCLMRAQAGDENGAVELAREALPLFFQRGHVQLAATVFRALRPRIAELTLGRDRILQVAHALQQLGDPKAAANAYATVLAREPGELRALRGTLALADAMLEEARGGDGCESARRLYRFLLDRAPGSPVAEQARRGLENVERRMPRSPAPA